MKKTKKYYRDAINKSYQTACTVFVEALTKYGNKCKTRGWRTANISPVSNNWNGSITGFSYSKRKLYVDVYWQGDSTDGEDSVQFREFGIVLPSESWFDGERTREDHSDIEFEEKELYQAMKNFADKYLK